MISPWLNFLVDVLVAIGTILVAIIAIWSDWIKAKIAGPKLFLELRDQRGNLTEFRSASIPPTPGIPVYYWHIKVTNHREWALAKRVRVMCTEIKKRAADGSFQKQPLPLPLQMNWVFPQTHEILPDISSEDHCDLGYLAQGAKRFKLSVYIEPHNFRGWIGPGDAMEVTLIAIADNFRSEPYRVRVHWDGQWRDTPEEMSQHLIVNAV